MYTGVRLKEKIKPVARMARGISHAQRLSILYLLMHRPMEAREIVADIDLPESLVSHHLKVMYASGWLRKTKVGRSVTYELNDIILEDLKKFFATTPFWRNRFGKD
ncbi:metalloregulator ArsR/SmtB family transcription factor [Patescibacteria group bacterium]|nr:metalloregulator ArsR/SmtB family transcription factor [Patescibacteria group bacterium]